VKLHDDQIDIDEGTLRSLLAEQRPDLAELPIARVASTGTVNALFRIGDRFVARLPLVERWSEGIDREWRWIPWLSERIASVRLPEPVFRGEPNEAFPFRWSVYRWIDGATYDHDIVDDERAAADTLAAFVRELRSLDVVEDAPAGGRDPLHDLDADTREAIRRSAGAIDADAGMQVWDQALAAPVWGGDPAWIHGDLLPPNVIVRDGRIVAVIDYGYIGVGDPATDLIPAWSVFRAEGRRAYRAALDPDDGAWSRGRGIALHQAAMIIPYYVESNPGFVEVARNTVEQIVEDFRS
jgi:aminoglycoside phosphotransferase (APT) family kinase protein